MAHVPKTPRWWREVVRTDTGRLSPTLPPKIPTLHQLSLAAFWPTPPQRDTCNWLKEATSPCDTPCDLILEKRQSPEDRRHLCNPVRWNLYQWRVAYKNTHPTCHGKTVVIHNHGVPGHGRFQTVHKDSYFGGDHIKAIFQDLVNAAGTEMGTKSH